MAWHIFGKQFVSEGKADEDRHVCCKDHVQPAHGSIRVGFPVERSNKFVGSQKIKHDYGSKNIQQ